MFNEGIRKPGGKVQRCIVVQRDENGFGLTVSGDNPVFVQSVKPGSAAAKAGVQISDHIIKVNGVPVAQSNHVEVVRLIKSGSYVALTLLGKDNSRTSESSSSPNSSRPSSAGHSRSRSLGNSLGFLSSGNPSSPPVDSKKENKVNELKRMLNLEHEYCKKVVEEYMKHPSAKAQQELAECQTRIHSVEQQLKTLTGTIPPKPPGFPSAAAGFKSPSQTGWTRTTPPQNRTVPTSSAPHSPVPILPPQSPSFINSQGGTISQENGNVKNPNKISTSTSSTSIDSYSSDSRKTKMDEADGHNFPFVPQPVTDINSAIADSSNSFDALFAKAAQDNLNSMAPMHSAASVMSMEEDEFNSDEERFDDHGPFVDLDTLKSRPAHLSVFLHYLMSNSNPVPLLFWLVTDVYSQETGSTKELKRWAYEIYSTFIATGAPLKVIISEPEEVAIEESFNPKTSEDRIKGVFDVARSIIYIEVNEQLADFRNKRALGLGGLFGDHQLEDNLDRNKELKVIEQTLQPHLDALINDSDTSQEQNDRNYVMAAALSTFLKQSGGPVKSERCHSFVEKEKGSFMGFGGNKKKVHKINGHQFVGQAYSSITMCNFCDKLLWGIGTQGYQCQTCEYNVHKYPCSESLPDICTGKKLKSNRQKPHRGQTSSKPEKGFGTGSEQTNEIEQENGELKHTNSSSSDIHEKGNADSSDEQEKEADRTSTPINEDPTQVKSKTIGYLRNKREQKAPKRPVTTLPGIGKSDFGVYGASPFKSFGDRTESPPESDEEDEPDSDLEIETENPNWQSTVVDKKILSKLKSKELKRQEVIHELIHTERTHVRNLKVLYRLFYKPLMKENIIPIDMVKLIFPNLEELIEIHESLLKPMKELVKQSEVIDSVGDLMLTRFEGEKGERVKEACANFCRSQKRALAQLKKLQITKRELGTFMAKQESNEYCRRLKFTDIIASTHQRLVKYPLLLDQINKSTPAKHQDYTNVEKAAKCCRDTLNHVNNEIKHAEDKLRLEDLSKLIEDKRVIGKDSEDENQGDGKFDITQHTLIMEGDLTWKYNPNKTLNLHVVLLEDLLVLLQMTDNGRFILKNHNTNIVGTTGDNKGHSPIIQLKNVLIREVAVDKMGLYLVSTSMTGPQIYELVAQTASEKRKWVASINKAAELGKSRDVNAERGRRGGLTVGRVASSSDNKKTITKQDTAIDESAKTTNNLPSPERMQELLLELSVKDEELMKTLEKKAKLVAEIRGEKPEELESQKEEIPNEQREIVLAAIAQTKTIMEAVNSTLSLTKDVSTSEQRKTMVDSASMLQQYLTALLNNMEGVEKREKELNPVKRSKSLEKPGLKSQLKSTEGSVSMSSLGAVISHARSHSSPIQTLDVNAVGLTEVDVKIQHEEEEEAPSKIEESIINPLDIENLPPCEIIESQISGSPSATTSQLPPPLEEQEENHLLVQNPFKIMKKRTSEPTMESFTGKLPHQQLAHNNIQVKPINRAASFSGFSNLRVNNTADTDG